MHVSEQHQNGQEKVRQNRNPAQTTIIAKSMLNFSKISLIRFSMLTNELFSDVEMSAQTNLNATQPNSGCNLTTSLTQSPNRLAQNSSHSLANNTLHTIAQPYLGDSSNFGAFYHHHSHHHITSYGNPYDKYKSHHARSPNPSPYETYQGFYSPPTHHHQIVRPNGYIDLVPR